MKELFFAVGEHLAAVLVFFVIATTSSSSPAKMT